MLTEMVRDLMLHKNHADSALIQAISAHPEASADPTPRKLLHHLTIANRFWLSLFLGEPFDHQKESAIPESMQEMAILCRQTQDRETKWLSELNDSDLQRTVVTPFIPDRSFSVAEAAVQVCLHSHGHRAQCAARLRTLGGEPPPLDFILWLKDRPKPEWLQGS